MWRSYTFRRIRSEGADPDRGSSGVLAEVADDVDRAAEAASTTLPWYGPHRGKGDVPRFFEAIASNVDISEFEIVGMTSSQSDVVTIVHWTFTGQGHGKDGQHVHAALVAVRRR